MKVALVSGGARSLGLAITRRLMADGWTVSVGARDPEAARAVFTGEAAPHIARFDAEDPATAESWVEAAGSAFGRIDALVNNAAVLRVVDFTQGDESDLDTLWQVNVKAPFRLIRAALPDLKAAGSGRVVNIASTDGVRYRGGGPLGYSLSKHALVAMTHAVRFAGWDDGVRATAICPGAIDTDMIADLPGATPKADRLQPETVADMVAVILSLPNNASVAELVMNTRLEPSL